MESFREDILNGIIKFITSIADHHPETEGILIIRKYEDGVRPNANAYGRTSCEENSYENSVFGEINIEDVSKKNVCKSTILNDCNIHQEVSIKNYIVEVRLDFFGCGAIDTAKKILDAVELWELRKRYLPSNIGFLTHTSIVDATALQETMHEERVTFSMDFEYCCETVVDIPQFQLGECIKELIENKCTEEQI